MTVEKFTILAFLIINIEGFNELLENYIITKVTELHPTQTKFITMHTNK